MVQLARTDGRGVPETTVTPLSPDLFDFRSCGNRTAAQYLDSSVSSPYGKVGMKILPKEVQVALALSGGVGASLEILHLR